MGPKRSSSAESLQASKRQRVEQICPSQDHFHPSLELDVDELAAMTGNLPDGHIAAAVKLVQRDQHKHVYHLTAAPADGRGGNSALDFAVEVPNAFGSTLELCRQDRILLSLSGCQVIATGGSDRRQSTGNKSRIALRYPQGILLKIMSRVIDGKLRSVDKVVNTWKMQEDGDTSDGQADEWFRTPPTRPLTQAKALSSTEYIREARLKTEVLSVRRSQSPTPARSPVLPHMTASTSVSGDDDASGSRPNPSKTMKRKLRKAVRESKGRSSLGSSIEAGGPRSDSASTPIPAAVALPDTSEPYRVAIGSSAAEPSSIGQTSGTPSKSLEPGVSTPLQEVKRDSHATLIGVVQDITAESLTRTGDWKRTLYLVDPSNYDARPFNVNCFNKQKLLVPYANPGDIVILRRVKIGTLNGEPTGIGYARSLTWATYNCDTRRFIYGSNGEIPEPPPGSSLSPFLAPTPAESERCLDLVSWWSNMKQPAEGSNKSSQSSSVLSSSRSCRRQHLLLSEVSPGIEPGGFFKCTVEILFIHREHNCVAIYTTDYTRNDACYAPQQEWCPLALRPYVFKFEFWDEATQLCDAMEVGDYYFFDNAKVKVNMDGLEAKMNRIGNSAKLEHQDQDDSHLRLLLERKSLYTKNEGAETNVPNHFPHILLEDAGDMSFFNCTVECRYTNLDNSGHAFVYVTDYTRNVKFQIPPAAAQTPGFENAIAKIALVNGQNRELSSLVEGQYYTIHKLSFKKDGAGKLLGRLGGAERLIHPISSSDNSNELAALLNRKETWGRKGPEDCGIPLQEVVSAQSDGRPSSKPRRKDCSLREVGPLDDDKTLWYRVQARVVKTRPRDLRRAAVLHCDRCQVTLQVGQAKCIECELEGEESSCTWIFQLSFWLEDLHGDRRLVSLTEPQMCEQLDGLQAGDFENDHDAFRTFIERLEPAIANSSTDCGQSKENAPTTPMLTCIIRADSPARFSLVRYRPTPQE